MKNKFLQFLFLSCSVAVLFSACRKDPFKGKETEESGKTFVWLVDANADVHVTYLDVFTSVKPVALFSVRRDPANKADLAKAVTVTLAFDADSTANEGLTPLTTDLSSFPTATDLAAGGVYAGAEGETISSDFSQITVKFAPGEFAKNIVFNVDGSKLDLTQVYGGVYKITSLGGFPGKVGYSVVAAGLAVKNQYDGIYSLAGSMERFTAAGAADGSALAGTIADSAKPINLITTGATSNLVDPGLVWADGSTGVGGIAGLQVSVDPITNQVTVTCGGNASLGNTPGLDNFYDPVKKVYTLNFGWYTGAVGASSSRKAHLTFTYKSPR